MLHPVPLSSTSDSSLSKSLAAFPHNHNRNTLIRKDPVAMTIEASRGSNQ